jgi:hypothetical protein
VGRTDGVNIVGGRVVKGAENNVSDYLDDIIMNGKFDAAKMNKLKMLFKIIILV